MTNLFKKIYFEISYFLKSLRSVGPIILMYHRIAIESHDPHLLCVEPSNFRLHLEYLSKTRKIVKLSDITKSNCPKNAVALTFDDGYADNLYEALPILREFGAYATVFVTAGLLGQKFPWDDTDSNGRCLSAQELKQLSSDPLIEIGAHSMTHPELGKLSQSDQEFEIKTSKSSLEQIIDQEIYSFAYPFGDHDDTTIKIVEKCGFKIGCAVRAKQVKPDSNLLSLPRYIIRNWNHSKFSKKIGIF